MLGRHLGEQGSSKEGDALDALDNQDKIVRRVLGDWAAEDKTQHERGTLVKLLVEHAAVREAAADMVAEHLDDFGRGDDGARLVAKADDRRQLIRKIDGATRGREPAAIAASEEVLSAILALRDLLTPQIEEELSKLIPDLQKLSEEQRSELPSAKHVRKHAPTHPPEEHQWYEDLDAALRVKTAYDRLRGFPWPESKPLMDDALAEDYDQEA